MLITWPRPAPEAIRSRSTSGGVRTSDRYAAAFENADLATLVSLVTEDVTLEMPPLPAWFAGVGPVTRFLASHVLAGPGQFRATPVATGQTDLAFYRREPDGSYLSHAIQVHSTARGRVSWIVIFLDPGLFSTFGLSPALDAATALAPRACRRDA